MHMILQIAKEAYVELGYLWWLIGINVCVVAVILVGWVISIGAGLTSKSIASDGSLIELCSIGVTLWKEFLMKQVCLTILGVVALSLLGYVLGYNRTKVVVFILTVIAQYTWLSGLYTLRRVKTHILARLEVLQQ